MKKMKDTWKDPVWSKVISAGIIFTIATIWAKFINVSVAQVYNYTVDFLNFCLPIYYFVTVAFIYWFVWFLFFRKKKEENTNPYIDEEVGHYTFGELSQILGKKTPKTQTPEMITANQNPPNENYLRLFYNNYGQFNRGVHPEDDFADNGFLYEILCLDFVGYGLLDKQESTNQNTNATTYQISNNGRKFYALLEKSGMFE